MRRRNRIAFAAVLCAMAAGPLHTEACTCARANTATYFDRAQDVVIGRVEAMPKMEEVNAAGRALATIRVSRVFKGRPPKTLRVEIGVPSACFLPLSVGVRVVLFLREDGSTSICDGSRLLATGLQMRAWGWPEETVLQVQLEGWKTVRELRELAGPR